MNMSLCGIPWWTTDIGGFIGGKPSDPEFRELLVRWFQFGLFLPVMRMHGCRVWDDGKQSNHPELLCATGADNEVWSYGEELYPLFVKIINIRESLRPYIMEQMRLASKDGTPLMRPLFFDFPHDETCYCIEDQYMFGPDILVAPITEMGCESRTVYLPRGKWIAAQTEIVSEGEREVIMSAPLNGIPAYFRQGSPVGDFLSFK